MSVRIALDRLRPLDQQVVTDDRFFEAGREDLDREARANCTDMGSEVTPGESPSSDVWAQCSMRMASSTLTWSAANVASRLAWEASPARRERRVRRLSPLVVFGQNPPHSVAAHV